MEPAPIQSTTAERATCGPRANQNKTVKCRRPRAHLAIVHSAQSARRPKKRRTPSAEPSSQAAAGTGTADGTSAKELTSARTKSCLPTPGSGDVGSGTRNLKCINPPPNNLRSGGVSVSALEVKAAGGEDPNMLMENKAYVCN